ncbi:MAG: phosphoribosylformylglycinamidine synthase I [Candidatus Hydrogenedentota bacterium]
MSIKTVILTGFGINCENETKVAFERAGSDADCIHLTDLMRNPSAIHDYQILAIPGGFSYGDDVASGKIFANRMRHKLGAELQRFAQDGKLAIGICNGFQVMVKMGLLPFFEGEFTQEVTLTHNDSDRFENRWVHLKKDVTTNCVWLKDIELLESPIRHGEGKFIPRDDETLRRLQENGQIALRYANSEGISCDGQFPGNPNGSVDDIAGVCDPSGRLFGLMPHPEAFLDATNHPSWTRETSLADEGAGLQLFRNAVEFAARELQLA